MAVVPVVAQQVKDKPDPSAKRLHKDVMTGYSQFVRPAGGPNHQLTVKMGMRLSQVLDVVSRFIFIADFSLPELKKMPGHHVDVVL